MDRVIESNMSDTVEVKTGDLPSMDRGADILSYFDDASKRACLTQLWKHLQASESSGSLDLEMLRQCIRLLPPGEQDDASYSKLSELVVNAIPHEASNPERLYILAELCVSNPEFGSLIFQHIMVYLSALDAVLSPNLDEIDQHASDITMAQRFPNAVAYLNFLKCSYWLPADCCHYVTPNVVQALCSLTGLDGLDDAAHDTLSALLSLLRTPIKALLVAKEESAVPSARAPGCLSLHVNESLIGQQLWNRFQELPEEYFASSSKAFRTWFQWVGIAAANGIELEGVYENLYWERLREGLLSGFSEQRKYCLGILRQSLQIAQHDIDTPLMVMKVAERSLYQQQYEKYGSLFETIVLDRYQNQIQACLPELTNLLGGKSLISPGWITTMLSAVLDPKIQEGVRKLIGAWYVDLVTQKNNSAFQDPAQERIFFDNNASLLTEGLLPWATYGPLFNAKLICTREGTTCSHGEQLSNVVSRFITASSIQVRRQIFIDVCKFILDRGGKIFAYATVHLLQGLLEGLRSLSESINIRTEDFELLSRIARIPGLPEICSDLVTTYCADICRSFYTSNMESGTANLEDIPGYDLLNSRFEALQAQSVSSSQTQDEDKNQHSIEAVTSLGNFLEELERTKHKLIKDDLFPPACDGIIAYLETINPQVVPHFDLYAILEAIWEEADRQQYRRPVAVKIPSLFFHRTTISICVAESRQSGGEDSLVGLLTKVMERLRQLAEGRPYLLSTFVDSLRKAALVQPEILSILPFEDFLYKFIDIPPVAKKEFLFEVAASEKLEKYFPQRTYNAYYGKREWHAYAAGIDLLNRFPKSQLDVAKNVLDRLLKPWRTQKKPWPIINKWKDTFQLQAMLILSESCITEDNAKFYLDSFMGALTVEQWPRWRYVLEWIISRIYFRFPHLTERILPDLAKLDDTYPIHIASLMKLAVLAAPFLKSENFTLELMTQLIAFSASSKVQIRHEAQWAFPMIWDIAEQNGFTSITGNPAFNALNNFIRGLDKFNKPAWTIRTLKLDAVDDFTLVDIFQGEYLTIETPIAKKVDYEDFIDLWSGDNSGEMENCPIRVPLGDSKKTTNSSTTALESALSTLEIDELKETAVSAPLQTKSGFDLSSLLPSTGSPTTKPARPASVILVASLIDNPTNLGGLSRISESFGLESLTVNSAKVVEHKDFQATAVTSHKHLPIQEVKVGEVPGWLIGMKREGWEVVGVEQTDRSGILGEEINEREIAGKVEGEVVQRGTREKGTLPKKCVLVLGSEKGGISSEVLAVVDRCVEIRTLGVTRSLNVQTAGGIAVYEWWREWGDKL